MKKASIRGLLAACVILAMILMGSSVCYADGQSIILSKSKSVTNGSTFSIDIVAKGSWPKLVCYGPITVKFDTSKFTFVEAKMVTGSGTFVPPDASEIAAGKLKVMCYGGSSFSVVDGTKLVSFTFKAKELGSGNLSFIGAEGFSETLTAELEGVSTGSAITVTVTAPVVKSSNNNLKSLNIDPGSLSPAFAANQASYAVAVAEGVSKLTVSAVAEDSKATVSVSGNDSLKDGDNKISVVVTAENGAKKTYTITATRAAPSPTPEPTPSPSPSPTPAVTVQVSGGPWSITDLPPEVPIPEGFYRTLTNISGQMVPTFKSFKGDLVLYYLANQAGEAGFYYYDSTKAAYQAYLMLTIPTQSFSVLSLDSSVSIPVGFNETEMLLNGNSYQAWQPDPATVKTAASDEYLLYLMNSQGDKGFYWYNKTTRLLSIYTVSTSTAVSEPAVTDGVTPLPQPDPVAATALDPWLLATILLGVLCLILLGLVIWLSFGSRRRRYNARSYSDEDGYDSWADLDDNDHDGHDHQAPPVKAPPIRRVE